MSVVANEKLVSTDFSWHGIIILGKTPENDFFTRVWIWEHLLFALSISRLSSTFPFLTFIFSFHKIVIAAGE
jgi:hypothetical protein